MLVTDLIIFIVIIGVCMEILMIPFDEPIKGDIVEWRDRIYEVTDTDYCGYFFKDRNGNITYVTEWEAVCVEVRGCGIQRLYRYVKAVMGV